MTDHDIGGHEEDSPETSEGNGFDTLGLRPELLKTINDLGYEEPTPIQLQTIPHLLAGRDLLGQAATGTGKTAAFALPALQMIDSASKVVPIALILVPTRELAIQVGEAVQRYGKELRISVLAVYGGQAIGPQLYALKRGVDVVVATPGRALDHIRRNTLQLKHVQMVVLDEADEMLDMGFADDLEAILTQTPADRQTALFSATMPPRIASIAHRHLKNPVEIKIAKELVKAGAAPRVQQTAYVVNRPYKVAALIRVLDLAAPKSALVFCRTRLEVDELTAGLAGRDFRAEAIHGGMGQSQRDRVMSAFKSGQTQILVATDVAARGLDIPSVSHVVNYDLPSSPEVYVHRIGRTGRAGREGEAITIVEPREHRLLRNIEQLTKAKIIVAQVPSVADLRTKRIERTLTAIREMLAAGDVEHFRSVVTVLAKDFELVDVAAAAVKLAHQTQGGDSEEQEIPSVQARVPDYSRPDYARPGMRRPSPMSGEMSRGIRPREGQGRPSARPTAGRTPNSARIYIGAGRAAGIRPGDLVGAIANEAKLGSAQIGGVEIEERFSLVEVPESMARDVIEALGRTRIKGQKVAVRLFRD